MIGFIKLTWLLKINKNVPCLHSFSIESHVCQLKELLNPTSACEMFQKVSIFKQTLNIVEIIMETTIHLRCLLLLDD